MTARKSHSPLYYSEYLKLDQLLSCQQRESEKRGSPAHDEMLFILVHQVYELWFKQILHELDSILHLFQQEYIDEKNVGIAVARLNRITEIQKILIEQLRVIETMTPLDFLDFRDFLIPASGFQSVQFRLIENKLGIKHEQRVQYNQSPYHTRLSPEHQKLILQSEQEPSLFHVIEQWLERTPFLEFEGFNFWTHYRSAVDKMLLDDKTIIQNNPTLSEKEKTGQGQELTRTEESFSALFDESKHNQFIQKGLRRLSYKATKAALLIYLYRDQPILHEPYHLLTTLVEVDELFTTWRYRHSLMVHRMIGTKIGTGGTSGHQYLTSTVERNRIFTDLFNLSTFLIPRSSLPELPSEVERNLGFYYNTKRAH